MGGWLFARRTSLPIPIALALLLTPSRHTSWSSMAAGTALVASGELLRLWAVRQIGAVSRTRSDRLGPLVSTGPFAFVRNPLYLGNIAIWAGFSICAGLFWLTPIVLGVLAVVYHAIVCWEEGLLESRLGASYRDYTARVPRWIPRLRSPSAASSGSGFLEFPWGDTIFSERGTLIAIAVGYALLSIKLVTYGRG